jgi:hypothetical protein
MADITITLTPAAALTRAVDAICALYGYQTLINGNPNPETRNNFAKRIVAEWVKAQVVQYESGVAMESARVTAKASAEALSIT